MQKVIDRKTQGGTIHLYLNIKEYGNEPRIES